MSVFIARIKKNHGLDAGFERNSLLRFLPFDPVDINSFSEGDVDGYLFGFGSALDSSISRNDTCTIIRQGYSLPGIEKRIEEEFLRGGQINTQSFPESFCAILAQKNQLVAYSSPTGVDQLFFYSTEGATYVTNRHNLLGPFVKDLTFKKSSFAWMAGRTHIGDMSTYWNEITRSKPGTKYVITSSCITAFEPDNKDLFDPIPNGDIRSEIAGISNYFKEILSNVSAEKRLWLSGGKDSRAIFGLIDCEPVRDGLSMTTGGELYSPDVMAAQDLSELVGLTSRHTVSRPAITSSRIVVSEKIANDLTVDFTGGSLADLRPVSKSGACIIGGHENGFKSKKNTKPLGEYIADRIHWVDNLNILTPVARFELFTDFRKDLIKILSDVPVSRYSQVDLVHNRNPNFLSSTITSSHISASEIHPFLDGRMYRLLCGVSDEALDSQFIHYAMMYNSEFALESLPFAADNWPDSLHDLIKQNNLPLRGGKSTPYKFNNLFPTLKSFGLYDWRLNLVDGSQNFVRDYINDNSGFFDFINIPVLNELLKKDSKDFLFKEVYTFLSLLKASFVHCFNEKLFDFSRRGEIAAEVNQLLDFQKVTGKVQESKEIQKDQENSFLKSKLEDYERSIAAIVRQHKAEAEIQAAEPRSDSSVLASIHGEAFASDRPALLIENILQSLGFQVVPPEGVVITTESINLKSGCVIGLELFMDNAEGNKLLISFSSKDEVFPDGFSASNAGFHYKYINLNKGYGEFELTMESKKFDQVAPVEMKIMPWYSRKPIFYRDISITKK